MVKITPAERTRLWRLAQKKKLGADAWKKKQRDDRNRQRKSKKLSEMKAISSKIPPKIPKSKTKKVPPPLPPKPNKCPSLLEKVFQAKKSHLASLKPPRTIKRTSVEQQFKKVMNIHKFLYGKVAKCNDLDFLRNTEKIIAFVNKHWKTPNSRATQIQAISSILVVLPDYNREYLIYSALSTKNRRAIQANAGDNILTEKERKNILPWTQIQDLRKNAKSPRDKSLIAMYTIIPPRRLDIGLIKLADKNTKQSKAFNYYLPETKQIIFNKYKTDKFYGIQKMKIPNALSEILTALVESEGLKPGDFLFGTKNNTQYKNFSQFVSRIFKRVSGKPLTINLLRHSYISKFLSKKRSVNEMKKLAKIMGHSTIEQQFYFKKEL